MGGKTSKSTQTVSIPPEVLARYNAVNARAEEVAGRPFQPYSYNPADFVAQLTPTQLAGIQNVNYAAGQAQPYFEEATNQLMGAQMAAVPYYAQAGQDIGYGQQYGAGGLDQATQALYAAQAGASPFNYAAAGAFQQGYGQGQGLLGAGVGQIAGAQGVAQPLQRAAQYNIAGAQDIGAQLAQQAYLQQAQAGQAAAPLQQLAQGIYGQAFQQAQPYNVAALQQYYGGLGAAAPISQAALANLAAGQQAGQDITGMALRQLGVGQAQATPIQQAALQAVGAAPAVAAPMTQAAAANLAAAQAGAQPYQQLATEFGLAGGRPVMPGALTGAEIGQFMSPYIQNVVAPTAALLNQQAQQAQAEQLGNAIRSGAFGGDRARIAAANLQQQQTLAQSKALSDIMQSGYGQALATAQQQQQLGLTAEQANRAAQQATAAQLLGIGQTGFGQGLGTAQQQAALAQQLYGQQLGAGQAQAALAQQLFGQGATAAQQQQAAAQALFGQSAQAAQQQAALAQQLFGQQAAAGQNIAGLGQQTFQQGLATGQAQQALAQQLFGQGLSQAQQQAALSQLLFGQGTGAAQQQAALAQQLYGQALGAGQGLLGAGQQAFQQGTGFGTAQQGLGQQIFGQGLSASQQAAALGQQGFAQQLAAAQARQGLGQGLYGMGAGTAQQLAALGTGAQGAALTGAQAQLAAGQAQQQTAQAGLQALYNQFLQQQAYPFQVAQFLGNIAMGTGALSGSTTTQVTPGGLFSDRRLKENVVKIGETNDGQPIYRYNYKGDNKTQIGLMAQDVEKKNPDAVGLAGGYKTVDYDKATRGSINRKDAIDAEYTAHEGGSVTPERAGLGFADGGLTSQVIPYMDSSPTALGIPNEKPSTSKLPTGGSMGPGRSLLDDAKDISDAISSAKNLYDTGKKVTSFLGFAEGGAAEEEIPYADPNKASTTKLDIPSEKNEVKTLPTPKALPEGRSVGEDVMDIAKIFMAMSHGGSAQSRHGYADGGSPGLVSPTDMAALLQAQAQMFGPYMQYGRPTGGMPGAAGVVPSASLPVSGLAVAKAEFPEQKNALETIKEIDQAAKSAEDIYKKGQEVYKKGQEVLGGLGKKKPLGDEEPPPFYSSAGGLVPRKHYDAGGTPQGASQEETDEAAPAVVKEEGLAARERKPPVLERLGLTREGQLRPDTVLPLLQGIAGMAAAPTRNLGVALAMGLGSYATGAQRQREFGIRQMEAQASVSQAQNAAYRAALEAMQANYSYRPTNVGKPWFNYSTGQYETEEEHAQKLAQVTRFALNRQIPGSQVGPMIPPDIVPGPARTPTEAKPPVAAPAALPQGPQAAPPQTGGPAPVTLRGKTPDQVRAQTFVTSTGDRAAPSAGEPAAVAAPAAEKPAVTDRSVPLMDRVARGDYGVTSFYPRNVLAVDESVLNPNDRISKLQEDVQTLTRQGQQDAANALAARIDRYNKGEELPTYVDPQTGETKQFTGYVERATQMANIAHKVKANRDAWTKQTDRATAFQSGSFPPASQILDSLTNIYAQQELNRGSPQIAEAIGYISSIPGIASIIPSSIREYQSATDEAQKNSIRQAMVSAIESGLGEKAPASTLAEALLTVANPGLAPGAKYKIVVNAKALLNRSNDFYRDWLESSPKVANVSQWEKDWNADPSHSIQAYEKAASQDTPYFAGMTESEMKKYPRRAAQRPDFENLEQGAAVKLPDNRTFYWDKKTQMLYPSLDAIPR
ncbi:MAG: tail fiber domain-containing protein [Actinobacteria bacterium]|nr:tail fiber domain-containing protein [Actinomycetota bacterium]